MVIVPSVIFSYPSGRLVEEVEVALLVVEDMAAVMTLLGNNVFVAPTPSWWWWVFGDVMVLSMRDAAADKVLLGSVLLVGATKVAVIDDNFTATRWYNDVESCLYPLWSAIDGLGWWKRLCELLSDFSSNSSVAVTFDVSFRRPVISFCNQDGRQRLHYYRSSNHQQQRQ